MYWLSELFYDISWDKFNVPKKILSEKFDNSMIKLVEFFSTNYFQVYWNEISTEVIYVEKVPLEKSLSPEEIYLIINGAKPLVIEWDNRIWEDGADIPEYKKSEVWLK